MVRARSVLAAGVCALAVAGLGSGAAFAGEVKGPPGSPATAVPGGNPNSTGALDHANSICAANGLNDYDTLEGQNDFHVQSYGIDVSGRAPSEPADPHVFNPGDACRGGSGER
ncbi:MAG TPA: hypothetical protein VFB42_05330 [Gaiellaceae bacterium]|nr:hypothetical protein [Gaiellaceae bacterium]